MKRLFMAIVLGSLVMVLACGKGDSTPPQTPTPASAAKPTPDRTPARAATPTPEVSAYREIEVSNGGTISGIVKLAGSQPALPPLKVTKNADVFGNSVPDEKLIVSADRGLKNTVVHIVSLSEGKKLSPLTVTVDNKKGLFAPHVQVAVKGSSIVTINSDPVLHNTHTYLEGATLFNLALPLEGQKITRPLTFRGQTIDSGVIKVLCDAHDWMKAYLVVVPHPYYAVTEANGSFEIKDIPPGKYQLRAWQEELGTQVKEVTVSAGGKTEVNFEFSR